MDLREVVANQSEPDYVNKHSAAFDRIRRTLDYIHLNLSSPLLLDDIAQQSCWSRWQLQRVFQAQTGLTVANYVRELKLSQAAEQLLDTKIRVIDIGLGLGFHSEISFSRSFKHRFGVSPSQYRKRGKRVGIKKPIQVSETASAAHKGHQNFVEVHIDEKDSFCIQGLTSEISGLFSSTQDFVHKVPEMWSHLTNVMTIANHVNERIGVVDVTQASSDGTNIHYWAGIGRQHEQALSARCCRDTQSLLHVLTVPKQTYAVVKHCGPITHLRHTLMWFLLHWLPESGYCGVDGYELEIYPKDYDSKDDDAEMEYWLPIIKA